MPLDMAYSPTSFRLVGVAAVALGFSLLRLYYKKSREEELNPQLRPLLVSSSPGPLCSHGSEDLPRPPSRLADTALGRSGEGPARVPPAPGSPTSSLPSEPIILDDPSAAQDSRQEPGVDLRIAHKRASLDNPSDPGGATSSDPDEHAGTSGARIAAASPRSAFSAPDAEVGAAGPSPHAAPLGVLDEPMTCGAETDGACLLSVTLDAVSPLASTTDAGSLPGSSMDAGSIPSGLHASGEVEPPCAPRGAAGPAGGSESTPAAGSAPPAGVATELGLPSSGPVPRLAPMLEESSSAGPSYADRPPPSEAASGSKFAASRWAPPLQAPAPAHAGAAPPFAPADTPPPPLSSEGLAVEVAGESFNESVMFEAPRGSGSGPSLDASALARLRADLLAGMQAEASRAPTSSRPAPVVSSAALQPGIPLFSTFAPPLQGSNSRRSPLGPSRQSSQQRAAPSSSASSERVEVPSAPLLPSPASLHRSPSLGRPPLAPPPLVGSPEGGSPLFSPGPASGPTPLSQARSPVDWSDVPPTPRFSRAGSRASSAGLGPFAGGFGEGGFQEGLEGPFSSRPDHGAAPVPDWNPFAAPRPAPGSAAPSPEGGSRASRLNPTHAPHQAARAGRPSSGSSAGSEGRRPAESRARAESGPGRRASGAERAVGRALEEGDLALGSRPSLDAEVRPVLKLDVVAGPGVEQSYVTDEDTVEVVLGRNLTCTVVLTDPAVSGNHAVVHWDEEARCWKAADLGSLNGTLLNGQAISCSDRKRGKSWALYMDDILQLGADSKVKITHFPRELLDPRDHHGSLPLGSLPRSLTMPKHRSLPISSQALAADRPGAQARRLLQSAACARLRFECCVASRVGSEHAHKQQGSEDVARALVPLAAALPRSEQAALGPLCRSAALFCLFDGHCGRGAAAAAADALPEELCRALGGARQAGLPAGEAGEVLGLPAGEATPAEEARGLGSPDGEAKDVGLPADELRQVFLATDARIAAEEGCTATAVLVWPDRAEGALRVQAANVGDSAAIFVDLASGSARVLTEDHRLTNPSERARLVDMGIQVAKDSRRLYGLNLSRCLGDHFLKDEDLGLSAEPYVGRALEVRADQGGLVLIATDGLWDVASYDDVGRVAADADREHLGNVVRTAEAVLDYALARRTKDDVTVQVVRVWSAADWKARGPSPGVPSLSAISWVC